MKTQYDNMQWIKHILTRTNEKEYDYTVKYNNMT